MQGDVFEAGGGTTEVPPAVPTKSLLHSKSFNKLRFGKGKGNRSKSLDSSRSSLTSNIDLEDGNEDTTWQIGRGESEAVIPTRKDRFTDLVIISTIGEYDGVLNMSTTIIIYSIGPSSTPHHPISAMAVL